MNNTPNSNRIHITILGKRNAGKSSLVNALTGQDVSLVSSVSGTTTDPVYKAVEFSALGPVLFIDTAGIDDEGILGNLRVEKTMKVLEKTDFALYLIDSHDYKLEESFEEMEKELEKYNIPYLLVISKKDKLSNDDILEIKENHPSFVLISTEDKKSLEALKDILIEKIEKKNLEKPIVGDLIPYNSTVLLVTPIDSQAPKGRLILPQVQVIRDCLDHGIKCYILRDTELESALEDIKKIDLVITDSQIFKKVEKIIPTSIKLTSFSMLFARHKGDLDVFLDGVKQIDLLEDGSNILIAESCTHNHSHEDIGRVKIPKLLDKYTGKKFNYHFKTGHDFPEKLNAYDLVIHCGSCMQNAKEMESRIYRCEKDNIPITNYGILLAYLSDILDRTIEVFKDI